MTFAGKRVTIPLLFDAFFSFTLKAEAGRDIIVAEKMIIPGR